MQFADFCDRAGLDRVTVANLMRTELLDISMWRDEQLTRPSGIFDDALPSRQLLAALGLTVRDDYDPDRLRSYDQNDEEEEEESEGDAGPNETLTW